MDVWITLDAFDWNVSGEQVQSALALAHFWHTSVGLQVHSGLALAQVWHLSSPVILIVLLGSGTVSQSGKLKLHEV